MKQKVKTIKENVNELLQTLTEAGVTLTEEQKASIEKFGKDIESRISEAENNAIKATKVVMERRLEGEFKQVFESILDNIEKNNILAGKIQKLASEKIAKEEAMKSQRTLMAEAVDKYLDKCLEEKITEKTAVDYDQLKKYETLFESMKDTLLNNDSSVKDYKDALEKKYADENKNLIKENYQLSETVKKLEASNKSVREQANLDKASAVLESMTRDLPTYEAGELRKRLTGKTLDEVQKNFSSTLRSIQEEMEAEKIKTECGISLEERINSIIDEGDDSSEKTDKATPTEPAAPAPPAPEDYGTTVDDEEVGELPMGLTEQIRSLLEDPETKSEPANKPEEQPPADGVEPVDEDDDGVVLSESEKIDSRTMQFIIDRYRSIAPRGRQR